MFAGFGRSANAFGLAQTKLERSIDLVRAFCVASTLYFGVVLRIAVIDSTDVDDLRDTSLRASAPKRDRDSGRGAR